MATSRIYIPRNAAWANPSLPELHLQDTHRKAINDTATVFSFLFAMAMIVAAFAFLIIIGPNNWGPLQ